MNDIRLISILIEYIEQLKTDKERLEEELRNVKQFNAITQQELKELKFGLTE